MTDTQLQRMAQAAAIIRRVIGSEFRWELPGLQKYGKAALMIIWHEPGETLRPYCNYDCAAGMPDRYGGVTELADALSAAGFFTEDCNGDYSGVYEVNKEVTHVDSAYQEQVLGDVR